MIKTMNNTLYFDGCNTVELAKKYGTPLYVFSENDIISRFDELKECFTEKYERTSSWCVKQLIILTENGQKKTRQNLSARVDTTKYILVSVIKFITFIFLCQ